MKLFRNILIVSLFFSLILTGCTSSTKEMTDAMKFKEEYESINDTIREKDGKTIRSISIDEDNPIQYATAQDILDKMDQKETFIVYFGFADCPWCRSVLETMISTAKDADVQTIYYVDIKDIRDEMKLDESNTVILSKEGDRDYLSLLTYLDPVLSEYTLKDEDGNSVDTNEKRIYAPNFVAIVDGQAKYLTEATSELETDPYMELSEEMVKDMHDQFMELFQYIKETTACDVETKC